MAANSRQKFAFSSFHNPQQTRKWLVPWPLMAEMSVVGPQLSETAKCLIPCDEHLGY